MNTIIYISFKAAQSYISKELCVNRNLAGSTCMGKCFLKSQMKRTEAKQKHVHSYCKDKLELFFIVIDIAINKIFINKTSYVTLYCNKKIISISLDVFRPPAV